MPRAIESNCGPSGAARLGQRSSARSVSRQDPNINGDNTHEVFSSHNPFPDTFILNHDGVVTARFFEPTYQERKTISSVLAELGRNVDAPVTKTTAPHLEITSYLTDRVAAPDTHFSIVLDIRPEPRVHVYAPGVTGYKPIALAVQPQPALVVREPHFPRAEDYFFKPLNEHVPVFQKPFRIVQDLELDPSREAASALKELKR